MQTAIINGQEIVYYTQEELSEVDLDDRKLYEKTYEIANSISNQLKIDCPYIGIVFAPIIRNQTVLDAVTYTPNECVMPPLKNSLTIISILPNAFDETRLCGTLAHELRHIWQYTYSPAINTNHAIGFGDSLMHPAEIDADGYAIWYLSEFQNMYFEKAAGIICHKEKKYFPKAYMHRIEKAKEIKAYFDEQKEKSESKILLSIKPDKESIFYRIKNFLMQRKKI